MEEEALYFNIGLEAVALFVLYDLVWCSVLPSYGKVVESVW